MLSHLTAEITFIAGATMIDLVVSVWCSVRRKVVMFNWEQNIISVGHQLGVSWWWSDDSWCGRGCAWPSNTSLLSPLHHMTL